LPILLRIVTTLSQSDTKVIPKWIQNEPKVIINWPQNDPKVIPKWTQTDPKAMLTWSQSDTKVSQRDWKWFKGFMDIKDSMINNEVWDALPHSGIPK
jgi:hypothetical protein